MEIKKCKNLLVLVANLRNNGKTATIYLKIVQSLCTISLTMIRNNDNYINFNHLRIY